jgi:hypothetical protein
MGWLTPNKIKKQRGRFKQLSVFHEVPLGHMGFDALVHQDPSNTETGYMNISRPIPNYVPKGFDPKIPVFGSFGFGLGGKGFDRLVDYVKEEFDNAVVRLNIPFAAFGDNGGEGARSWVSSCRSRLRGTNIYLDVGHDLLEEGELIEWLSRNSVNCFLYDDNYGRGISGTLDYALAARKPIAITRSYQFKHFWSIDDTCTVYQPSDLRNIYERRNSDHLEKYRTIWGDTAVRADWERIFDTVLGV